MSRISSPDAALEKISQSCQKIEELFDTVELIRQVREKVQETHRRIEEHEVQLSDSLDRNKEMESIYTQGLRRLDETRDRSAGELNRLLTEFTDRQTDISQILERLRRENRDLEEERYLIEEEIARLNAFMEGTDEEFSRLRREIERLQNESAENLTQQIRSEIESKTDAAIRGFNDARQETVDALTSRQSEEEKRLRENLSQQFFEEAEYIEALFEEKVQAIDDGLKEQTERIEVELKRMRAEAEQARALQNDLAEDRKRFKGLFEEQKTAFGQLEEGLSLFKNSVAADMDRRIDETSNGIQGKQADFESRVQKEFSDRFAAEADGLEKRFQEGESRIEALRRLGEEKAEAVEKLREASKTELNRLTEELKLFRTNTSETFAREIEEIRKEEGQFRDETRQGFSDRFAEERRRIDRELAERFQEYEARFSAEKEQLESRFSEKDADIETRFEQQKGGIQETLKRLETRGADVQALRDHIETEIKGFEAFLQENRKRADEAAASAEGRIGKEIERFSDLISDSKTQMDHLESNLRIFKNSIAEEIERKSEDMVASQSALFSDSKMELDHLRSNLLLFRNSVADAIDRRDEAISEQQHRFEEKTRKEISERFSEEKENIEGRIRTVEEEMKERIFSRFDAEKIRIDGLLSSLSSEKEDIETLNRELADEYRRMEAFEEEARQFLDSTRTEVMEGFESEKKAIHSLSEDLKSKEAEMDTLGGLLAEKIDNRLSELDGSIEKRIAPLEKRMVEQADDWEKRLQDSDAALNGRLNERMTALSNQVKKVVAHAAKQAQGAGDAVKSELEEKIGSLSAELGTAQNRLGEIDERMAQARNRIEQFEQQIEHQIEQREAGSSERMESLIQEKIEGPIQKMVQDTAGDMIEKSRNELVRKRLEPSLAANDARITEMKTFVNRIVKHVNKLQEIQKTRIEAQKEQTAKLSTLESRLEKAMEILEAPSEPEEPDPQISDLVSNLVPDLEKRIARIEAYFQKRKKPAKG